MLFCHSLLQSSRKIFGLARKKCNSIIRIDDNLKVRFGSLADLFTNISLMTAFGGIADPEAGRKVLFTGIGNGHKKTLQEIYSA